MPTCIPMVMFHPTCTCTCTTKGLGERDPIIRRRWLSNSAADVNIERERVRWWANNHFWQLPRAEQEQYSFGTVGLPCQGGILQTGQLCFPHSGPHQELCRFTLQLPQENVKEVRHFHLWGFDWKFGSVIKGDGGKSKRKRLQRLGCLHIPFLPIFQK